MNVSDGASLVAHTVKSLPAMQETRVPSPGQEGLLEKDMATHSSILDGEIPWTEEPGRLKSGGCKESERTEATEHSRTVLLGLRCSGVRWPP